MYTLWGSVEFGPPGPLEEFENYNDMGVPCMNAVQQRDLMAVQVVVKVYIEMVQLHLAVIREEMLETTGECPAGFELGDWSDDSGECCCDPSNQNHLRQKMVRSQLRLRLEAMVKNQSK